MKARDELFEAKRLEWGNRRAKGVAPTLALV